MAPANLLALPYEILELILLRYLTGLEISVRYTRQRINTRNYQDGTVLLLVCKFIHNIAKPMIFETVIFGHRASHLLKDPTDGFSLVLAPACLPMDKFLHVCFDLEYAVSLLECEGLWPWSTMRSLRLVMGQSLWERSVARSEGTFFVLLWCCLVLLRLTNVV